MGLWRRKKEPTVYDVEYMGKRIAVYCGNCNSLTYIAPEDTHYSPKMELQAMARIVACPTCGYSNPHEGPGLLTVKPEGH